MEPVAVFSLDRASLPKAQSLASAGGLRLIEAVGEMPKSAKQRLKFFQDHLAEMPAFVYLLESGVLQLALVDDGGVLSISAGFHDPGLDYRRQKGGGRSEQIAKAVGLKGGRRPSVVDATAGLGVDAFVLANLGCRVVMLERVRAVSALLRDGLERSRLHASEKDAELSNALERMHLVEKDAAEYLNNLSPEEFPEVIYLDPMFPERKKSAAVKKEMQVFHRLVGPDDDAGALFEIALRRAAERVVVKRPRIAGPMGGREPSHVIAGKRNRYDVYLSRSPQL